MKTKLLFIFLLSAFCNLKAQITGFKITNYQPVKVSTEIQDLPRADEIELNKLISILSNSMLPREVMDSISTRISELKENIKKSDHSYTPYTSIIYHNETKTVPKLPEVFDYKYETKKLVLLERELDSLNNLLDKNSDIGSKEKVFDSALRSAMNERIIVLKDEINKIKEKQEELYAKFISYEIRNKNVNIFLSSHNARAFFDLLYDGEGKQFKGLSNAGLNIGNSTGSIYSELVSGNLGLIRASIGTMVSTNNSEDKEKAAEEEAYQRLITYGGNTVLNLEYPCLYMHTINNQYNCIGRFIAKGTCDLPAFGTRTESWAGSASFGLDLYLDASTSKNELRFFLNTSLSQFFGTSEFRTNLGIENNDFLFGQLTAGIVIKEYLKISLAILTYSNEDKLGNRSIVAGGQVLR